MHRSAVGLILLVVVVATLGSSGLSMAVPPETATGGANAALSGATADGFADRTVQEFDSTTFDITIYENGTATWTFTYERILSTESEEAEFESFAEEFESEETDLYRRFTDQAQALTESGSEATGREMDVTNFDRRATIEHRPNAMGVVEMEFTWTNFAPVDDDGTVTVGDVFDGGLYIGPSQTLTIRPGGDLTFARVQPDGQYTGPTVEDSPSVSWSGEHEFLDGQPQIVLELAETGTGGDADTEATPGGTDSGEGSDGNENTGTDARTLAVLVFLAALGVGTVLGWRWYTSTEQEPVPAADSATQSPDTEPVADTDPISDAELMTDEDRVVALIRENGGRMKQVNIVEETGWSKSKVSMLLSEMESEGTISKLRVGRENIISLEGFEPEATKSPFEE